MNQVNLSGNLVRDPETKVLNVNGKQTTVTNFTVATSRYFKRKDGSSDKETTFVDCEAWDSGAESIAELFTKGSPILLTGSLKSESWEAQDGTKRSKLKIRVDRFERLSRAPKPESDDNQQPVGAAAGADASGSDDDIPF